MNMQTSLNEQEAPDDLSIYLDTLSKLERLHRLLLDVVKDEFERLRLLDINSVQGLLLFNIGEQEVTAGELKSRGYYQGSNVSYNLKKLVETGYMHHEKCAVDRRAVRVRLTDKGQNIRQAISDLFARHAEGIIDSPEMSADSLAAVNTHLRHVERFWTDQIRYIY
ncbi:MAG: MarR family winged helix-turn-helix transcriptional regulator [Alphaproteobacteria bacterium]